MEPDSPYLERRANSDRRAVAERRAAPRETPERRSGHRRSPSRTRFAWKTAKRNALFVLGLLGTCLVVAVVIGASTRGLETMFRQASLALTAMDDPTKLTGDQKAELKKMIKGKTKGDAKKSYDAMTPEQKAQAKQQFGTLSEDEKKKYRQMFGK